MQGITHIYLSENPHILSDLSEPHEEEGKLSFFKNVYKTPSDRVEGRKGALFQVVPFPNCPKCYGRHIESCSIGMTKEQSNVDVLFRDSA
jgi:hypothetical protein